MNIKRGITYLSGVRDGRYNRENCGFEKSWECNGDFIFPFLNCLRKKKYLGIDGLFGGHQCWKSGWNGGEGGEFRE